MHKQMDSVEQERSEHVENFYEVIQPALEQVEKEMFYFGALHHEISFLKDLVKPLALNLYCEDMYFRLWADNVASQYLERVEARASRNLNPAITAKQFQENAAA